MMMRCLSGCLLLLTIAGLSASAVAQDGDPKLAYTDPAQAPIDFTIQGEYLGKVRFDQETPFGVQIIALGGGRFRAVGFFGGLPGDAWHEASVEVEGRLEGSVVRLEDPQGEGRGIWQDGRLRVENAVGEELGVLERIERRSPTLGQKPPEGAIVLFDGTSLDEWEKGRMTADGLLMEGAVSKRRFRDFFIHLEFCTPFQPFARGQARGNSGFYAQGRYEVQILDSFGGIGAKDECGAIYGVAAPRVNMCFPPLSWQTYDIEFRAARFDDSGKKVANARMTVRHNGVLIHDSVEIPGPTRAALIATESPEPGPIYLQDHGNPVRFRNIWVIERP